MSSTTPTIGATRTRPPATTIAAVVLQVLIGTVTSCGGLYFGLQAGGGWIVSAIGLIRGSARARKVAVGLATALLGFSAFKIIWIHESASYLVASLDLVLLACLTATPTRRFSTR